MNTYRVSSVEAFRRFESDDEAGPEEMARLILDIINGGEPSQAMAAGTAFHKVLELAQAGEEVERVRQGDFLFTFKGDFVVPVTPIRELRSSKVYTVDGEPIRISGQVDAIDGLRIEDHKTTGRFDADRYLAGYQWRLYLDIFNAQHFRWNVFEIVEVESIASETFEYEVTAQHRLEQYRYPALEVDCLALVTRFARFVRERIEQPETA